MRDINLFPQKPFAERNLTLLVVFVFAVGVSLIFLQLHFSTQFIDAGAEAELEKSQIEEGIRAADEKNAPDPRTLQYRTMRREVDQLKLRRTDWLSDITYIVGFLPNNSVIKNMNVDTAGLLQMELHFAKMPDVLSYLAHLETQSRYPSLKVTELTKVTPDAEPEALPDVSMGIPVPPAVTESSSSPTSSFKSEYYRLLLEIQLLDAKKEGE